MKEVVTKVERYLNPVAQLHLLSKATYKVLIAGRGFSKSFLNGLEVADIVDKMPGSKGIFSSPTYAMIYTNTLLPMKAAWQQHMGYIEDIHYVVGKIPPKYFKKPYHRPTKYENVVTFWNGTTVIYGSWDRPSSMAGGSNDWFIDDEAFLHDKEELDLYVIPTLRGTHPSFKSCDKHLQRSFTSSMPFKGQGDWLLDFRNKAMMSPYIEERKDDPDYISYSFLGWEPNAKVQKGSTFMNRQVLGDKAIKAMLAEMGEYSAKVMIHNQQVTNWGNTFYPALGPKHWYTPKANDLIINLPLGSLANFKRNATHDDSPDDYNPNMPLHISHDWGAFNCITIDQEYPREIRFINTMHVHHPKTIDDLADEFAEYYRMHKAKIVYQWGDKSGNNKQANAKLTYFQQFAERLRDKDWRVIQKKTGDITHLERHRFIVNLHNETDTRFPKVRHNSKCKDFRIALEAAGMKDDEKDKSSERNQAIKPEHATHYTDAYDYRLYHAFKQRESRDSIIDPSGTNL